MVVLGVLLMTTLGTASAETIELGSSKDNTIYAESRALSNGAGYTMFAGVNGQGDVRRLLIAFDLSEIPSGSTITSAVLHLYMIRTSDLFPRRHSLRKLLADWGEENSFAGPGGSGPGGGDGAPARDGDATWTHTFYETELWITAGGDFSGTESEATNVGVSRTTVSWGSTPAMVADVQGWLDNPATNFGWMLLGTENQISSARAFYTKESTDEVNRPRLVIEYTPPVAGDAESVSELKSTFGSN
jgi:hypothetical protein